MPEIDPSTISYISLIIASIIALITFWGVRSTNKTTRDSNKLLQTDLEARLRPLLEFQKPTASLQSSGDKMNVRFSTTIKNIGTVPARKIVAYLKETNNDKIENLIKEKDVIRKTSFEFGTIPNGAHKDFATKIKWEKDKVKTQFVMWFEYLYLNNQQDNIMIVFDITPGSTQLNYVWFGKEDIKEAEKKWNELMGDSDVS